MFASGLQDIDVVITTRELARMIKQSGIDFLNLPDEECDHMLGDYTGAGVIFGATGGVMEAALRTAYHFVTGKEAEKVEFKTTRGLKGVKESEINIAGTKVRIAVAHGLSHVEEVINKIREAKKKGEELPYHFVEVMACPGGCVGGGGQPYMVCDELRKERTAAIYQDDDDRVLRVSHKNPYVKRLYADYIGNPLGDKAHKLFHTEYKSRPQYTR